MGTSQRPVHDLRPGDVVTLADLEGARCRRYGKVVRVEKPHRGADGSATVVVAVQYRLDPGATMTVTESDDWDPPPG